MFGILRKVVEQGKKFDPNGSYTRRWIPELAALDDEVIHEPWKADPSVLESGGIVLGTTYPAPIVDHAEAREATLAAYGAARAAGPLSR